MLRITCLNFFSARSSNINKGISLWLFLSIALAVLPNWGFSHNIQKEELYLMATDSSRDAKMKPDKIIEFIGLEPGMIIGEGGAGSGYLTLKLARQVGENGKVYANDISKISLEVLLELAAKENINNVETILGEVDNPLFPKQKLDIAIVFGAFHEFTEKLEWLKNLKQSLKTSGTLVIVDQHSKLDNDSSISYKSCINVAEQSGYEFVKNGDFIKNYYVLVFRPNENLPYINGH